MVVHPRSYSQHNMLHQATWLFPLQSNRFSFLGNPVSASAYTAILCYSKGAAVCSHAFQRVLAGVCASTQRSVVMATSRA